MLLLVLLPLTRFHLVQLLANGLVLLILRPHLQPFIQNGNAALVSEEYLRNLEETCYLYSIPGMREKLIEGINTPLSECVEIDWEKELQ